MKRANNQPVGDLTIFAGIFLKTWTVADKGTILPQHSHDHPHISFIVSGSVRVWCDVELMGDFTAPAVVKIAAKAKHTFETLSDGVMIACIHALGDGDDVAIHEEHHLVMEG